jgi:N-formylglutamate amidohydrolase
VVPDQREVAERVETYWRPYHDRLYAELAKLKVIHGVAMLLDVHSIPARAPRFFEGRLPDLNLGAADGMSAAPGVVDRTWAVCAGARGFSAVRDGRFKGGYITRRYGQPDDNVHAVQIEIVQASYMTEGPPWAYDAAKAAAMRGVVSQLVGAMTDWASHAVAA